MSLLSIPVKSEWKLQAHIPALLLLGGTVNGFVVRIIESWQLSGGSAIFFGISPLELIVIAVAAIIYIETQSEVTFNPGIAELAFLAALLIPSSAASWAATFFYAVFHATRTQDHEQNAALLMAALAASALWSSIVMKWIAIPVTNFEASLVWQIISQFRDDLTLNGNIIGLADGHRIVLLIACTTAYGLPKAALGFFAISLFLRNQNPKSLFNGLVATVIFYAAANLVRLISMSWSEPLFHIAHGPIGTNLFDATTTAAIFLIAFVLSERQQ